MPRTTKAAGGGKRHPLNMRTTREIREQLEAAAAAKGRSLAQEVEARLQQSFQEEDFLDRVLGDQAIRNHATLMAGGLRRGGELGASARGHPEWTPTQWLTDPFALAVAGYSVMQALGIGEPPEQDLPMQPTAEEFRERGYKAFALAVAANVPIKIPPYPHPSAKSEDPK